MVDVWLPYGKTEVCLRVPTRNFLGSIEPREKLGLPDAKTEVDRALREPIDSKRLAEIVMPENRVAIVVDDATRQVPSSMMTLGLLNELNSAGVKDENVTIIFACGAHRAVKPEETLMLLGKEVIERVRCISHDSKASDLVYVGDTQKHGTRVFLNRVFAETDVRILTGDVCFHCYSGYSGGRESVLPGVAGEETIKHNHSMLLDSNARTGVLDGNPIHEDMVEAARLAKIDFVLNVVTNTKGEIIKAFAGSMEQAFMEAVETVDETYRVTVDRKADIVVVSPGGNPADINLFQAYEAIDNALPVVKRGGVVILLAECSEGHGNQVFYDWMAKSSDLKTLEREIKRNFVSDGHKAYRLVRSLQNHQIILVSSMPDYYASNVFKLKTARSINDALAEAFNIVGQNAKVWTMSYGNFMLPEVKEIEEQNILPTS